MKTNPLPNKPGILETIQVDKKWIVEGHVQKELGVVISITDAHSAKTVDGYSHSPRVEWITCASCLILWEKIPKPIRVGLANEMFLRLKKALLQANETNEANEANGTKEVIQNTQK